MQVSVEDSCTLVSPDEYPTPEQVDDAHQQRGHNDADTEASGTDVGAALASGPENRLSD